MSEIVDEMPDPGGGINPRSYPWDEWFDGRPHRLRRGTRQQVLDGAADFSVNLRAMRTYAYVAAQARGLTVFTVTDRDQDLLYVRVERPGPAAGEAAA